MVYGMPTSLTKVNVSNIQEGANNTVLTSNTTSTYWGDGPEAITDLTVVFETILTP